MTPWSRRIAGFVVVALCGGVQAVAQEVHHVPDRPRCAECRIALTEVRAIGTADGPGMIDWRGGQAFAALDSRGRVYLRGNFSTRIKVYDGEGRYLTTIGREGEGPGEFKGVNGIAVGPADSLHVFDALTMRLSVFGPDHQFARSVQVEIQASGFDPLIVPWDPGHYFMTSHMRTADLIGWPIHRVRRDGRRVESFGSKTGEFRPSEPYSGLRIIGDAGGGSLWSARLAHYTVERVLPGVTRPLEEVHRESDWFPEPGPEDLQLDHGRERPHPMVVSVREEGGLLWILTWVADSEWQSATTALEDEHLRYDTVIEVIDLSDYRVVARSKVEELYQQLLGDTRVGGTVFRGGYIPTYRIMKMAIVEGDSD